MGNELENSVVFSSFHPKCVGVSISEFVHWYSRLQRSHTSKKLPWSVFFFPKPDKFLNTKCNEVILMQMKLHWEWMNHLFSFVCVSVSLSHRHQSSGSGGRPQARAERTWRGHRSVAQPGRSESHNHSGHMDGKCKLSFCEYNCIQLMLHQEHHSSVQAWDFPLEELTIDTWNHSLSLGFLSLLYFTSFDFSKLSHNVKVVDVNIRIPL